MKKVIVLDNVAQEGLDLLDQADGIEYSVQTGLKGESLRAALAECDGAICRSGVKITAESLAGNNRMRAIVRAGVGTDNIDKTAATAQGIIVMNTPTGNTVSTAEHAFALMAGLSRNLAPAHQSLAEGRWDRKKYMGSQLADKTLGVVGMGRIGQEVSVRAKAFDMRVIGFDPFLTPERAAELGISLVENVADMLPDVDYLTVHTPLTPETKDLIGFPELEIIKPGARLINCARGGIYNEEAMIEGLKSGKLGGVALDVYADEPCTDSPLFTMPDVLCTPHLGASTEEAQTSVAVEAVELLVKFLQEGEIRHSVNTASIDPQTLSAIRGYLDVSYRLGRLLDQWHTGNIRSCTLRFRGDVSGKNTNLMTSSFCAGLVESAMENVNIVNAQVLLEQRGIEVAIECRADTGTFKSSIAAEIETDNGKFIAGGTLFGNNLPRLILLNEYRLEAYLDGIMLIFAHDDVPGIIGSVGSSFGRHDVNIGQMSVGRGDSGNEAVGVLNLDGHPSAEALAEIKSHEHIRSVAV
ncbi:phosphoglycerate dehydrogenase, partial [Planctomycetota bacterium]